LPSRPGLRTALIPCAGLGTRLLPLTRVLPKELLPYRGLPMIQHVLQEMARGGIRRVVLVIRPDKDLLYRHLHEPYAHSDRAQCPETVPEGMELVFVRQARPEGLAGALLAARPVLAERFLLVFPDQLLRGTPGAASQLLSREDGCGSFSALVRIPPEELGYFQGARGMLLQGQGPVFEVGGVLAEEDSLPGAPGQVRAFGRTVLDPSFLELLGADPTDAAFGRAMEAHLRQGRHRALLLEGSPVDLGTMEGYRYYTGERG
jgi:UTP--glucose-1-phosphate uridylyltransferase